MTPGTALRALHAAGRLARPCLPGMLVEHTIAGDVQRWRVEQAIGLVGEPVLDDPATVGCLAALAREAIGEQLVVMDGEALAAALVALAREVAP